MATVQSRSKDEGEIMTRIAVHVGCADGRAITSRIERLNPVLRRILTTPATRRTTRDAEDHARAHDDVTIVWQLHGPKHRQFLLVVANPEQGETNGQIRTEQDAGSGQASLFRVDTGETVGV